VVGVAVFVDVEEGAGGVVGFEFGGEGGEVGGGGDCG